MKDFLLLFCALIFACLITGCQGGLYPPSSSSPINPKNKPNAPKKTPAEPDPSIDEPNDPEKTPTYPDPSVDEIDKPNTIPSDDQPDNPLSPSIKKESFFSWLRSEGVKSIFENAVGHNKKSAKNVYIFFSKEAAQNFKNNFLNDPSKYGEVFFDKRLGKNVVPINESAQDHLKNLFEQKHVRDAEDVVRQRELLEWAKKKLISFNQVELQKDSAISRANYGQAGDRIAKAAALLKNGGDGGWYMHAAASALDLLISIYRAQNDHLLSNDERKVLEWSQQKILNTNNKGNFITSLKADANFVGYLLEQYGSPALIERRRKLIREDVDLILNGGRRTNIDKNTPQQLQTIISANTDENSFVQPRFFPDENGASQIDTLLLQAGGMARHSSMRNLSKKKDNSVPDSYRYFYKKIDAGAGAEDVDHTNWIGHGIFATEITPYFEVKELYPNIFSIIFDDKGNPKALNDLDRKKVDENINLYRRHMFATLFALLDAERQILFYRNPEITVDYGEGKGILPEEAKTWHFWNNKILALRGKPVPSMHLTTPLQQSGNCTMYSAWLTFSDLIGVYLGFDFLQESKQYTYNSVLSEIEALIAKLSK